jgi:hypothetical protein
MRFQQVSTALGQDDDAMTLTRHWHGANQSLFAEVPQVTFAWVTGPAVVVLEVTRGNDAKDSDETQRAGFRTAEGVLAVSVADQLAFEPARQVELVDEHVARVDRVAVACVIVSFTWIASPTGIIVKHNRNLLKKRRLDVLTPPPNRASGTIGGEPPQPKLSEGLRPSDSPTRARSALRRLAPIAWLAALARVPARARGVRAASGDFRRIINHGVLTTGQRHGTTCLG